LATDDQGVSRSDITHEYLRAVETYALKYADLKRMARQSLEHSFIPGASIWADGRDFRRIAVCERDEQSGNSSVKCEKFLETSERARVQSQLERAFAAFEKTF
jgi:adenosine deaminase